MDLHNQKRIGLAAAAMAATTSWMPPMGLLIYIVLFNPGLPAWQASIYAAVLASFQAGVAAYVSGRKLDGPLQESLAAQTRIFVEKNYDEAVPHTDKKGALGQINRIAEATRQAILAQMRQAAESAEHARLATQAQDAHEHIAREKAREQEQVVTALAGALSRLAEGDLACQVGEEFPAGYQQLKEDFNAAVDQLRQAMHGLKTSALSIRAGTEEISQSAEDLSRRTESQAASLEETAAALDQITQTVRKTADGAAEASSVTLTAKAEAEQSGEVVRGAVAAMGEIERSAQQISQIIGVIDEIAFQTNLLALNAGVEAARAGEAGRGFAVVASEVRALAQRSAGAAKEIKSLISTSTAQVNNGVELVGRTGLALERILSKVAEINQLVAEIATSAKDQALGLHEINASIGQMDHTTQQNAAMVQETTAASLALASEVQQLSAMINRFDIGAIDTPTVAVRPSPPAEPRVRPSRPARSGPAATAVAADADGWEEF